MQAIINRAICFLTITNPAGSSFFTAPVFGAVLPALIFLFFIGILILLRNSVRESLYSYKNVLLAGGTLYIGITAVYIAVSFFIMFVQGKRLSADYLLRLLLDFPQLFSNFALGLIIVIAAAVFASNISLIRHEGLCLQNLLGIVLGLFFMTINLAILFISNIVDHFAGGQTAQLAGACLTMFLLLVLCYFECMFAATCILAYQAARHIPAYDKDYVIVLGCSIDRRGGLLPLLKGRANRAVRFAWDQERATGLPCRYVPSGGQGPGEIMSEGSAIELYLLSHGAESYEVFPEKKSTSTYENMLFSKEVIDRLTPGARVAYATTNYHVFRSGILARRAGLDAEGIAAETKWYFWPNGFIREFFAIMAENGKTHLIICGIIFFLCAASGILTGFFILP